MWAAQIGDNAKAGDTLRVFETEREAMRFAGEAAAGVPAYVWRVDGTGKWCNAAGKK